MNFHVSIFLFIFSLNVNASVITLESIESSTTTLKADLQGLEWLSLDDPILGTMSRSHSYREITGFGSIWEVDNWRVATYNEIKTLVDSLLIYGTVEDVVQFVADQWGANFYQSNTSLREGGVCEMAYNWMGPTIDAGCLQGYNYRPDVAVDFSGRFHVGASLIGSYNDNGLDFWNFSSAYSRTYNYFDLNGDIFHSRIDNSPPRESHGRLGYSFDDPEHSNGPFFLVRNVVEVPEPSTISFFAVLICMIIIGRKKVS
jgi:hypothetical protein